MTDSGHQANVCMYVHLIHMYVYIYINKYIYIYACMYVYICLEGNKLPDICPCVQHGKKDIRR
jgi:hypothetical protein